MDYRLASALQERRLGEADGQPLICQEDRLAQLRAPSWPAKWLYPRLFNLGSLLVELGTQLEQTQPLVAHSSQEQQ
jgi:hypothetical protein